MPTYTPLHNLSSCVVLLQDSDPKRLMSYNQVHPTPLWSLHISTCNAACSILNSSHVHIHCFLKLSFLSIGPPFIHAINTDSTRYDSGVRDKDRQEAIPATERHGALHRCQPSSVAPGACLEPRLYVHSCCIQAHDVLTEDVQQQPPKPASASPLMLRTTTGSIILKHYVPPHPFVFHREKKGLP